MLEPTSSKTFNVTRSKAGSQSYSKPRQQKLPSLKDTLKQIDSISKDDKKHSEAGIETESDVVQIENTIISNEQVQDEYNLFVEGLKGEFPRFYSALKLLVPKIKNNKEVYIAFQNNALLDEFRLKVKPSLLSHLRSTLSESLEIIDEVTQAEKMEKPLLYSDNERLQHMIDRNPALLKLKNTFNLDFD